MNVSNTRLKRPRRTMLYGVHGIGKSTFGAMAESPVFIPTEDGLSDIDCQAFPLARSFDEVIANVGELYSSPHEFRTVVLDSLDWLERLIWIEVCRENKVDSIDEIPYAKGHGFAMVRWRKFIAGVEALWRTRNMAVLLLGHAQVEKFNDPETDPYDRYSPRLHKHASAYVQEWCDEVLFARYTVHTTKTEEGFNKPKFRGIGDGERVILTTERPGHIAKNRLGLPDSFALDYRAYAALLRGESAQEPTETAPATSAEPATTE